MDPELETYKQTKIAEATNAFNSAVNILKANLNSAISYVNSTRINSKLKVYYINLYISNYNISLTKLKTKLTNNIKTITSLVSIPGKKQGIKTALLIGINYTNTAKELYGCINDATNIKSLLESKYGYKNITILTDETNKKPTKQNIITELTNMLASSVSGDTLFFAYSGHGTCTTDLNKDEIDGQDELIVPIDATSFQSCILDDELNSIIKTNLKPGVKLFALFDSCFSGTVLDLKYNYIDSTNFGNITINPNVSETSGQVLMISGCTDKQTSTDTVITNGETYINCGAMTFAFLDTIGQNKSISLKNFVQNMRTLLKNNGYSQIPQLSSGTNINIDTMLFSI
jgi:hypothetical protein